MPQADHSHGLLGSSQQFDSFSSMSASLDSAQHAEAFKHGYAKASQIVPYAPLRHGSREPAQSDQLPEVRPVAKGVLLLAGNPVLFGVMLHCSYV
jgi:hypothetical protein